MRGEVSDSGSEVRNFDEKIFLTLDFSKATVDGKIPIGDFDSDTNPYLKINTANVKKNNSQQPLNWQTVQTLLAQQSQRHNLLVGCTDLAQQKAEARSLLKVSPLLVTIMDLKSPAILR